MTNITFTSMRNRRLRQDCREAMERRGTDSADDVIDEVLTSPVPKGFFVSVDHALEVDRKYRNGTLPPFATDKGQMWEEFITAVNTYQRKKKCTRQKAVIYVVAQGTASRYFLTRKTALSIINNNKKYFDYDDYQQH